MESRKKYVLNEYSVRVNSDQPTNLGPKSAKLLLPHEIESDQKLDAGSGQFTAEARPEVQGELTIYDLLNRMITEQASDVHINAGSSPTFRIDGELVSLGYPILTPLKCKELVYSILSPKQIQEMEELGEIDFSFSIKKVCRVRGNAHLQKGTVGLSLRNIPWEIPSFEDLRLPKCMRMFCEKLRGLVLITGPTGAGKSTTLAAMVDYINKRFKRHIITVEDPIEYIHYNKKSIITQREINIDTLSFQDALRNIFRQDPDIVVIGEMRDHETVKTALSIAETGHLTLATMHTSSAVETVNRIINTFSSDMQNQVRNQLSFVLEGIISQRLIPRYNKNGRILAAEIMIPNAAICNMIRDGKTHQISTIMQLGQSQSIMRTMNQSLTELYQQGEISQMDLERFTVSTSNNGD